jgi:uridylate kinase
MRHLWAGLPACIEKAAPLRSRRIDAMKAPLRYKRVLLKLSGEALLGGQQFGIDDKVMDRYAGEIGEAVKLGVKVGVVVGGGNIFRGMTIAKAGGNRVAGDQMGILATIMNGIALQQALDQRKLASRVFSAVAMPAICPTFNQREAQAAFDAGEVCIFVGGIGHPYVTTDTGAALRAAEMGCDALLKGTQVDGVYSADPKHDKQAVRHENLTYQDVLHRDLKVMDTAAIALARDNRIPVIVFSIKQPGAFIDILKGKGRATVVAGS